MFCFRFAADDVNFSINTDDTCVTGRNMVDDYELSTKLGLTRQQLIKAVSIIHSLALL